MTQTMFAGLDRGGAEISDDGVYRYRLWRDLGAGGGLVAFVMLNPSTADGTHDDPTLRRCIGYGRAWGFDALEVVNLYAYRATDPRELLDPDTAGDPIGPLNDEAVAFTIRRARLVVAGWGAGAAQVARRRPDLPDPRQAVAGIAARYFAPLTALGVTRAGDPRHPLYLPADARPERWRP